MRTVPEGLLIPRASAWFLTGVVVLIALAACISENDLTAEQRAYTLDQQLMCPICDGQTIDQSHSQLAQDMKVIVREKIDAGETNQEIRDYFVARYGEVVLAAPEASGFNLLVWIMPAVIAGGGGLIVFMVLRNMRRKAAQPSAAADTDVPAERQQLGQYLDKVDTDIGYHARPEGRESGNG